MWPFTSGERLTSVANADTFDGEEFSASVADLRDTLRDGFTAGATSFLTLATQDGSLYRFIDRSKDFENSKFEIDVFGADDSLQPSASYTLTAAKDSRNPAEQAILLPKPPKRNQEDRVTLHSNDPVKSAPLVAGAAAVRELTQNLADTFGLAS